MAADAQDRGEQPQAAKGSPLTWAALSAALIALGFHRRKGAATPRAAAAQPRAEPGRGREARAPSEIPGRGWRDILKRTWAEAGRDRLPIVAAGAAFYAILAFFPALAALVSIYGLFADPATIGEHLQPLANVLPGDALALIREELSRIAGASGRALGFGFALGLGLSLWSANAGMKTIFDALNIVYDEEEKRGFLALNAWSLAFTLAAIVLVLSAIGLVVALPLVLGALGLQAATQWVLTLARWPLMLAVVGVAIAALYRYGPSRERARWRWVTWGAAAALLLWLVASLLFSWYVANFADYNKTYGSLGAVVGLMMWMWLSTMVVLMGAELDAEIERQTMRDTTTGPERPLGQRGAIVADKAGAARD